MDTVLVLSSSILAAAMAAALIWMAHTQASIVRVFGTISRTHREDMRTMANFAINTSRVYSNEFLRSATVSNIRKIDGEITRMQESTGLDRADAVQVVIDQLNNQNGDEAS